MKNDNTKKDMHEKYVLFYYNMKNDNTKKDMHEKKD